MTDTTAPGDNAPAAPQPRIDAIAPFTPADRFRVACRMLRQAGFLDEPLPEQRAGESPIDWLVRHGLAPDPHVAAEMLILGRGLREVLDELTGAEPV